LDFTYGKNFKAVAGTIWGRVLEMTDIIRSLQTFADATTSAHEATLALIAAAWITENPAAA